MGAGASGASALARLGRQAALPGADNTRLSQVAMGSGAVPEYLQSVLAPIDAQRNFMGAGTAPIPGATGPAGMPTNIPGLPPMRAPMQPMNFNPQEYLAGLAARINGQPMQQPGMPQGLIGLPMSNPNVRRFTGGK